MKLSKSAAVLSLLATCVLVASACGKYNNSAPVCDFDEGRLRWTAVFEGQRLNGLGQRDDSQAGLNDNNEYIPLPADFQSKVSAAINAIS